MEPVQAQTAEESPERDARFAVEAARWAPSVHNTQPWRFGVHHSGHHSGQGGGQGSRISLRADVERRLEVSDPDGREMLISCGAALFTLCVAVRRLGYVPRVRLLPDPDRPHLLADVDFGDPLTENEDARRLYGQIRERRTHRGAFRPDPVPASLLSTLRQEAQREGATLHLATDVHTRGALAALTQAAEHVQRLNPAYVAEAARWAPAPRSPRQDGVHEGAYPKDPARTEPHFPGRDYARGLGWGAGAPEDPTREPITGTVAVLTTTGDTRADWLRAGQALQRVLLRAGLEEDISAAFHTQALEVPELREFIRTRFCAGDHPQMLLRLGRADGGFTEVRRPVGDVLHDEA